MLLTRSGEYALRALIYLADRGSDGLLRTGEIADALGVPRNYLSKLLHQLVRAGVLRSGRGPQGGFALCRAPHELSLEQALAPIEAERIEGRCLLGRPECTDADPCPAHEQWRELRAHISRFLQDTTIDDLLRRRDAARPGPRATAAKERDDGR